MSSPINAANSTLSSIREKVRKVTGKPSPSQISNDQIDFYINTFYLYDMPEQLRLFDLKTNYVFTTEPNVAVYDFPFEEFVSVEQPFYVDGYPINYHQDQTVFFSIWPKLNFQETVGTGDGATTAPALSNLVNVPVLQKCVTLTTQISGLTVSFIDNGEGAFLGNALTVTQVTTASPAVITTSFNHNLITGDSVFISGVEGTTAVNGGPFTVTVVTPTTFSIPINTMNTAYIAGGEVKVQRGSINYVTGALTMEWGGAPDAAEPIIARTYPYKASRPYDVLFFENQFNFRPVPDAAYKVEVEVYKFPTQLLSSAAQPQINQWWQYLAYGAALKIFADSGEMESHGQYYPLFNEQERLVLRKTLRQLTTQRVLTPFAEESMYPSGNYYPFY